MNAVYFVKAGTDAAPGAAAVASALLAAGLGPDTPVALIELAGIARAYRAQTTLGTLGRDASEGTGPALVLVGEIPQAADGPPPADDEDRVEGEDAFVTYGRSWFC